MMSVSRRPRAATIRACAVLAFALPILLPAPAASDPPPWAPAHGYRAKQKGQKKHGYRQYRPAIQSVAIPRISLGDCNRELVIGAIGGAAGGLIGSKIGKGTGKLVATATGAVIGFLVGGSIGRSMDRIDQSCVGRVLERAQTGQTVAWNNPVNGGHYEVTPLETRTNGQNGYCREYTARATVGGQTRTMVGTACRQSDGAWKLMN